MDEPVSGEFLGRVFGKTDRWVRVLADKGIFSKVSYGKYDLAKSVQAYVKHVVESEIDALGQEIGSDSDTDSPAVSRGAWEAERARKLKLENDEREALLVKTPDALAAIDHIFGLVRTALSGIPARLTDDVQERRRLETQFDVVLSELAERLEQAGDALRTRGDPLEADGSH
jgi:phage terminase Nu1 subunit (DNA packaging protein)